MGTPEAVSPLTWQRTAIRDKRLGSSAVAVAAALVTIAPGRPGDFYGSVPRLMELSRLGERSVRGVLATLLRLGYLLQVRRGGRHGVRAEASTWRLTVPNTAAHAGWEAVDNAVDNPADEVPNLHDAASQPAPSAVPREKDFQERHMASGHSGYDAARVCSDADADGVAIVDALAPSFDEDALPSRTRGEVMAELERRIAAEANRGRA